MCLSLLMRIHANFWHALRLQNNPSHARQVCSSKILLCVCDSGQVGQRYSVAKPTILIILAVWVDLFVFAFHGFYKDPSAVIINFLIMFISKPTVAQQCITFQVFKCHDPLSRVCPVQLFPEVQKIAWCRWFENNAWEIFKMVWNL